MSSGASTYLFAGCSPIIFVDFNGNFKYPAGKEEEYELKYPALTNFLKNEIKSILENPEVMAALAEYGQMTVEDVTAALTWGSGPEIIISNDFVYQVATDRTGQPIQSIWGETNREKGTITLSESKISNFEADQSRDGFFPYPFNIGHLLIGVTVIHELTHYGDSQDGMNYLGEEGELAETAIFGELIDFDNAINHIAQWNSIMGNSLPVIQGSGTFLADDSNQLNSSEARPIQLQTENNMIWEE